MRVELPRIEHWWHELGNCLYSSAAIVLAQRGVDPVDALGAFWGFQYRPGDARREEYYFPCLPGVSVLESVAPGVPVRSRWHQPDGPSQGWSAVRTQVLAGRPAIVAVDNFHLPFRPAYHDVHTNHLLVVCGFDDEAGTATVIDSVPPRHFGPLPLGQLADSRGSANPVRHDRDMFFTDNPIRHRWLEIEWTDPPEAEPDYRQVLRTNLARFDRAAADGWSFGQDGIRRLFATYLDREVAGGDGSDELFVVAGAALANTALHADYLHTASRRLGRPALAEAGRWVSRVAHHWTALRILAIRGRGRAGAADAIGRRGRRLIADIGQALDTLQLTLDELDRDLIKPEPRRVLTKEAAWIG